MNMTRREERELKRRERKATVARVVYAKRFRGILIWLAIIGVVSVGGWAIYSRAQSSAPKEIFTNEPVHWHAKLDISICGKEQVWSYEQGLPTLHTHGDGVIHVEGRILDKKEISLGRFFDKVIKQPFDQDKLYDKKNSDKCPDGKEGKVQVFVNGQPNNQFRDFILEPTTDANSQIIRVSFE